MFNLLGGNVSVEACGAKALNLHILEEGGVNVPHALVIPITYYYEYVRYKETLLSEDDVRDRVKLLLHDVWCDVKGKIRSPVILRSSTCEEDGEHSSCAGIYHSSGPVEKFDVFIYEAIMIWESYDSLQAKVYRMDNGHAGAGMAIIVQTWIEAEKRGVLFSCDPRDGREVVMIEMAMGQMSDYDSYEHRIVLEEIEDIKELKGVTSIGEELLLQLKRTAAYVREIMGCHVDVEWVWKEKLYIVQARPITTLEKVETKYYCGSHSGDCVNACLIDRYSQPATPAYLSLLDSWQDRVNLNVKVDGKRIDPYEKPLCFYYGRVYWNLEYQKNQYNTEYSCLEEIREKDIRLYDLIINGADDWYARVESYERELKRISLRDFSSLLVDELRDTLLEFLTIFCDNIGVDHYQMLGIANICYEVYQRMLDVTYDDRVRAMEFLKSGEQNETTKSNEELYNLAKYICTLPKLKLLMAEKSAEDIYQEICESDEYLNICRMISDFLDKHGHRGTGCDDLYYPHWAEKPTCLINLLKQYCSFVTEDGESVEKQEREHAKIYTEEFELINRLTVKYMNLREDQRYYFDKSWIQIRRIYMEIGRRMVEAGVINEVEDIFFLHNDEVIAWLDGSKKSFSKIWILRRKNTYHRLQSNKPPYLLKNGESLMVQKRGGYTSYKVTVVSVGYTMGRTRYVESADDLAGVRPGEILVVPTFHPSWTPVMRIAGGIIMSYGNILSHAAVVAREYGIPVVIYNDAVDKILLDGVLVEVDGARGRIRIMREDE